MGHVRLEVYLTDNLMPNLALTRGKKREKLHENAMFVALFRHHRMQPALVMLRCSRLAVQKGVRKHPTRAIIACQ